MSRAPISIPRTRRWGVLLAGTTAVVSGVAVFVNGYGVRAWRDAGASSSTYTTFKNLVAAGLLLGLFGFVARSSSLRTARRRPRGPGEWLGLAFVGLIGGSVPFLLFFEGLARASSSQAALLHKTLLIWVAVLAVPLLKERLDAPHVFAIGLLIAGQLVIAGGVTNLEFGTGEWMVLAATLLWSVEVVVAKRLLAGLSSTTVGAARMGLGVVVLVGYGFATGAFAGLSAVGVSQWWWIGVTGGTLAAYVATWYAGLARAQAIDVTAVLVFGAVITALLQTAVQNVALPSAIGLGLISAGALVTVVIGLAGRRRPALR